MPALRPDGRLHGRVRERTSVCPRATREAGPEAHGGHVPAGGGLTLGQVLEGVWEGLSAGGTAACPVCGGPISLAPGATATRCDSCGSALS